MAYLRGTTFQEQTLAGEISHQVWAGPAGIGWVIAFAAAAARIFSPSAIREFLLELRAKDNLLFRFGWLLLGALPLFAICAFLHGGIYANTPWIKPMKFAISFATFVWTVSLFLSVLRIPAWKRRLVRRTVVGSVTIEMLCLAAQAWRNVPAGSGTFADFLIFQGTTAMVSVNTVITIWLLIVFSVNRERIKIADAAQVLAIRLSIVIFLLGNAIGGYMLSRGAHTVGAHDGGPGLPFLGWSTIAGDLRISHFIAIHAIQIVPLFAFILWRMAPRPALRRRRMAVAAAGLAVACVILGTFLQALLGYPLLSMLR
ncbi:MAG TPA: hypothetical protein VJN64_05820 [Terriglobales bacterium]|nr:hypothetical protein [Terriglobales bacterium]